MCIGFKHGKLPHEMLAKSNINESFNKCTERK